MIHGDGWPVAAAAGHEIIIIAGNDRKFRTLCDVLGVPELTDDDRLPPPELDEHGNQIRRWLAGPRQPASGLDL